MKFLQKFFSNLYLLIYSARKTRTSTYTNYKYNTFQKKFQPCKERFLILFGKILRIFCFFNFFSLVFLLYLQKKTYLYHTPFLFYYIVRIHKNTIGITDNIQPVIFVMFTNQNSHFEVLSLFRSLFPSFRHNSNTLLGKVMKNAPNNPKIKPITP